MSGSSVARLGLTFLRPMKDGKVVITRMKRVAHDPSARQKVQWLLKSGIAEGSWYSRSWMRDRSLPRDEESE